MIPLKDWNRLAMEKYREQEKYPKLNGLECPICLKELSDKDATLLKACPAEKEVVCTACRWMGWRIA